MLRQVHALPLHTACTHKQQPQCCLGAALPNGLVPRCALSPAAAERAMSLDALWTWTLSKQIRGWGAREHCWPLVVARTRTSL